MGGTTRSVRRALGALAVAAIAATAQHAAAEDIDTLRDEAERVGAEITAMSERLEELGEERRGLAEEIARADQEVAELELAISETEDAYERALERFEERAVEAYKDGGGGPDLALLLSAKDFTQMETLAQAISESAELDAEALEDLQDARAAAEDAQARLDQHRQDLMAAQARKDALATDIEDTIAARDRVLAELNDEIAEVAREAREEAREEAEATLEDPEWTPGKPSMVPPANPTWGTHDPNRLVGTGPADGIPPLFTSTGVSFEGEASWYGPGFEGNTTANGDIFDSRLYTVASKTLAFGTYLYVEHGGRGVVVYVNDRGPYAGDRILDLSHAAAQAIGIGGVGWVRAQIIVKK